MSFNLAGIMEEEALMTYAAVSHQGAIKKLWLHKLFHCLRRHQNLVKGKILLVNQKNVVEEFCQKNISDVCIMHNPNS